MVAGVTTAVAVAGTERDLLQTTPSREDAPGDGLRGCGAATRRHCERKQRNLFPLIEGWMASSQDSRADGNC
jgi:hypothetical protein